MRLPVLLNIAWTWIHYDAWALNTRRTSTFKQRRDADYVTEGFRTSASPTRSGCNPFVQVFGLFNTGTNLLERTVRSNFPDICLGSFWKHSNLNAVHANLRDFSVRGGIGLAMVRDPLSWLQSMRKAPYNLVSCIGKDDNGPGFCTTCMGVNGWPDQCERGDWLNGTCTFTVDQDLCSFGIGQEATFKDLPSVWTNWTQSYEHLSQFGLDRSVVIRYERLVLDPENVVRDVAVLAGIKPPDVVHVFEQSTKTSGGSQGRWTAIQKLRSKSYLQHYRAGELVQACSRLDWADEDRYNYTDCAAFLGFHP